MDAPHQAGLGPGDPHLECDVCDSVTRSTVCVLEARAPRARWLPPHPTVRQALWVTLGHREDPEAHGWAVTCLELQSY